GGAVVDGDNVGRAELDRFREAYVLSDRAVDELFITDAVGIEEAGNGRRSRDGIRDAAGGEDLFAGAGQVGRDHRAREDQLLEGRRQIHRGQRAQVAAIEE